MKLRSIAIGSALSFLVSFAVLFILALFMYFTAIDEGVISAGVYAGAAIGIFIGALFAAKSSGSKVLLHSLAVSLIFVAVLTLVSLVLHHGIAFNMHFITMIIAAFGAGFLGAVVGK